MDEGDQKYKKVKIKVPFSFIHDEDEEYSEAISKMKSLKYKTKIEEEVIIVE